nr:HlyU family transcriptional regulator [uncultured Celeribacter sp.]
MSLFSKLFGGSSGGAAAQASAAEVKPELYSGFRIFPTPIKAESGFRICARIEKEIDGDTKVHEMIRADTISTKEEAEIASLRKAQVFIDQMGNSVFDS